MKIQFTRQLIVVIRFIKIANHSFLLSPECLEPQRCCTQFSAVLLYSLCFSVCQQEQKLDYRRKHMRIYKWSFPPELSLLLADEVGAVNHRTHKTAKKVRNKHEISSVGHRSKNDSCRRWLHVKICIGVFGIGVLKNPYFSTVGMNCGIL